VKPPVLKFAPELALNSGLARSIVSSASRVHSVPSALLSVTLVLL
jgi:hypothetical protein